ncbi:pentatricopeptide repeat (PPR) superfamily protein [Tasmannia lanceolata]|uniref:pentatricopeptide repeat (PPR) superfamily protein n=1 Tax=Tasmannia lanceolata TaxID=3420 RepID=UPI0040648863
MALSKPLFFLRLKTPKPYSSPSLLSLRPFSFASPEEAAAERRRRKRRLRIEPPLNALRHHQQPQQPRQPPPNPNAPKLPDSVSVLSGNRLNLHNRILTLIRQNDLDEASLLVRHSIYSNCRPTVFTCNSVLSALLRQSRYSDLLSLHRFITQAAVVPNIITHNLLINAYCDCRKTDTALEHYKQLINDAPFNPSPTTYRILIKALAATTDNSKLDRALALKDEMLAKGLAPDPIVYNHLMLGFVKNENPDKALEIYAELREKLGGFVPDGVVYGSLMKGHFKKGMETEAMSCCDEVLLGDSRVRMGAIAYNSVLDALSKNGKFDEAAQLFGRMMEEHDPPRRLTVNLGSFNVMVDMFCVQGRFTEAIQVFRKMGEKKCVPDVLSYNNLIEQLCANAMVVEAEDIYREMGEQTVSADEFTYVLIIDACFGENRVDDAAEYFKKMVESGLRPNVVVYNKVIGGLVKAGKINEAKRFFDLMVEKELKPDATSYDVMLRGFCEAGMLDEVLKMVGDMLTDNEEVFSSEIRDFVEEALRKEGREEDLTRLFEEKEREKAEALAKEAEALKEKERAEALAKEAEAEKAAANVKAISASIDVPASEEEGNSESLAVEASPVEDGQSNNDGSVEELKSGDGKASEQVTVA